MFSILSALQIGLLASVVTFVLGVVFSQKIKDWVRGVPSDVRKALGGVEANAIAAVKSAQSKALDSITSAIPSVKPVAPPVILDAPLTPSVSTPAVAPGTPVGTTAAGS